MHNLRTSNILGYVLKVFTGGGPENFQSRLLEASYIRMVDHTIREYRSARTALLEHTRTPNDVMGPLFVATGHMEAFLISLRRAIRFLERIKRDKYTDQMPRRPLVLSSENIRLITDMRNSIEHLDKDIMNKELLPSQRFMLQIRESEIVTPSTKVSFKKLEVWLSELHAIAISIAGISYERN